MATGAITGYVDVAQIVLYVFWAFFAGLIYYLLRENINNVKRQVWKDMLQVLERLSIPISEKQRGYFLKS